VEIFLDPGAAPALWRAFLDLGAVPCGLGARDTLRLEMGYPLHGNDITDETTPLEAGLSFAVDFDKPDFIGRDALLDQKGRGVTGDLWVSSFLSAASRANTAAASKTGDRSARSPRGASRP
jgi:aminomethyltransferase